MKIVVVGAGVFGITAALELRHRGHDVTVLDSGPLPGPYELAASCDSSRAVRMDYGGDAFYVELACEAHARWRHDWRERAGKSLYFEAGFLFASATTLDGDAAARGFEAACFETLSQRGLGPERLTRRQLAQRFPLWSHAPWVDGYFNPNAGYADAAAVLSVLQHEAECAGVQLIGHRPIVHCGANHVRDARGVRFEGDALLIAAGAWTGQLLPELSRVLTATAQTVLWFAPEEPARFDRARYPTWAWDIAQQGWYGFPVTTSGLVKVAHHGAGRVQVADDRRADPALEARARAFLARTLPDLADAPLHEAKACFYCDSIDGDFWIAAVPERPGVFVATGGSGHGFKFAPILGELVANQVEGRRDPRLARFAWRDPDRAAREHARAPGAAD